MPDKIMTLNDFETLLDRYGAVLDRWPTATAAQANELLAASSDANRLLARSSALDELLDESLPAATLTTAAVRERILADITREAAAPGPFAWLLRGPRILRPIAVAVALIPLLVGYAIGIGYPPNGVNEDLVADVSLLAFSEYEGMSDAN